MATPLGLARLRGRSPAELVDRLRQLLSRTSEQLPWWRPLNAEPLPALLTGPDTPSWPLLASPASTDTLRDRWPDEADKLVREAAAVLEGRFRLLGFDSLAWETPVDWHLEPNAGLRAPRQHWSRVPFLDASRVGDHKVVWELNRHQFLVTLAQASLVTGDRRYGDRAIELMLAWLRDNPPATGINWASSLEVAFRAISWLWTLRLLEGRDHITAEARRAIDEGLYCHGRHLERYLSTWFSPNTHLTGEALGLLYLGTHMRGGAAPGRWADTGRRVLIEELGRQVSPDGTHFEQSSWYHRYTVDFYLHALSLGGWDADSDRFLRARCVEMARALLHMTRPDGSVARLGDDDGGTLVRLDTLPADQVTGTLHHAALVLDLPVARCLGAHTPPALLWLAGPTGLAQLDTMLAPPPEPTSVHLPDAGWHAVRDQWDANANWMLLDAGPVGGLAGGHGHADVLSLEIWVDGVPILVDPGTGCYVGPVRDQLRETSAHNTVTLAGEPSSDPAGPFSWASRAVGTTIRRDHLDRVTHIVAEHTGFSRLAQPAVHRRAVTVVAGTGWIVTDRLSGRAARAATSHFQLAADCTTSWIDGHPFLESARGRSGRGLLMIAAAPGRWQSRTAMVSSAYGRVAPTSRLDFDWGAADEAATVLLICCTRPEQVLASWSAENDATQVDVTINGVTHHVLTNPARQRRPNGRWHTDAEVMWVREGSGEATIDIIPAGAAVDHYASPEVWSATLEPDHQPTHH